MAVSSVLTTATPRAPEGFVRVASAGSVLVTWKGAGHGTCLVAGSLGLVLFTLLLAGSALEPQMARGLGTVAAIVAVVSAYLLLVGLLNRTVLCLRDRQIAVRQRPLPCPWTTRFQAKSRRPISAVDVYQVLVEQEQPLTGQNDRTPEYSLAVMTIGTGRENLLSRLSLYEARYLEQEINVFVGTDD